MNYLHNSLQYIKNNSCKNYTLEYLQSILKELQINSS